MNHDEPMPGEEVEDFEGTNRPAPTPQRQGPTEHPGEREVERPGEERARERDAWRGDPPFDPADDTVGVREIFLILRRRAWMIVACMALGGVFAWYLHRQQEPQYHATAVVRIEDPSRVLGSMAPGGSATNPVRSSLEVLRSQTVLGRIVDEEGLRLVPLTPGFPAGRLEGVEVLADASPDTVTLRFGPEGVVATEALRPHDEVRARYGQEIVLGAARMVVPARPGVEEARFGIRSRQAAVQSVGARLSARPRDQTDVVDVGFFSTDPYLAQRVANRAVVVFRERNAEQARRESVRRRAFLGEQLAQADSSLQQAQRTLSDFRSREEVFSSRDWIASQQSGLMDIDMRREELRAETTMFREILDGLRTAELGDIAARLETLVASPAVAGNPIVSSLYQQLLGYETSRDSILSGPWAASAESPDVLWANQQIANTRERLERAVRSHLDAQEARIEALAELRSRSAARISSLPAAEAEEFRLLQEVESIRRAVDELRSEYYRAQVAEALEEGGVEIVDLAPLPFAPQQAGFQVMLALGLLLGFMAGSGGAFLLEMLNTSIRHQDDLERTIPVATVGVIPKLPRGSQRWIPIGGSGGGNGNGKGSGKRKSSVRLVTHSDQRSRPAEAFRTLRTNLLFSPETGRGAVRTLVVTSALAGEGKTTTVANLAVAYAQQGLRVLVVDCDLRRPGIAGAFGVPHSPGITDLVLRKARAAEAIHEFGGVKGLWVTGAGEVPDDPTEFLGGARTRRTLATLAKRFDLLIVDTPPLSGGADAAILGSAVDGVLMVVKAGATDQGAAKMALRQLDTVGARLVGAVLNDPAGRLPKYGYYYQAYGE